MLKRAVVQPSVAAQAFTNLAGVQFAAGETAAAEQTLSRARDRFPNNPGVTLSSASLIAARGAYDTAATLLEQLIRERPSDLPTRAMASFGLAALARTRGRLSEAIRRDSEGFAAQRARGIAAAPLDASLDTAFDDVWFRGDSARALRVIDAALAAHPIDSLAPVERPYLQLVTVFALAGRVDRAKSMLAGFDRSRASVASFTDPFTRPRMEAQIAIAEGRYADAIRSLEQMQGRYACKLCTIPDIARAYDLSAQSDSAIAYFSRYLRTGWLTRTFGGSVGGEDPLFLAGVYKRLGELYEAKGDRAQAAAYFTKFVELWKNADPELQPRVLEIKKRLARLRSTNS